MGECKAPELCDWENLLGLEPLNWGGELLIFLESYPSALHKWRFEDEVQIY